ncbi:MAG: hypothetical protein ACTJHW_15695 [Paenalcaligenes sp.]
MIVWIWLVENYDAIGLSVAGFIGAAFSGWLQRDDIKNRRDYAVFVASGAATAHFVTPLIAHYLGVSGNTEGIGFLVGAFGGRVIQEGINWIKSGVIRQFIMGRWGK